MSQSTRVSLLVLSLLGLIGIQTGARAS